MKRAIGMGYYFRQRHELLLVGTRGAFPAPEPESRPDSVIESERQRHSQKPDEVYAALDRKYPELATDRKRIELFQRHPRDGWAAWGNEVKA